MARRGSGFNTAVRIVKAIDRASKQAAREKERRWKQQLREEARLQREHEQIFRQQEREEARQQREYEGEQAAREKARIAEEKSRFKQKLENANDAFKKRCTERKKLRNEFIDSELR